MTVQNVLQVVGTYIGYQVGGPTGAAIGSAIGSAVGAAIQGPEKFAGANIGEAFLVTAEPDPPGFHDEWGSL